MYVVICFAWNVLQFCTELHKQPSDLQVKERQAMFIFAVNKAPTVANVFLCFSFLAFDKSHEDSPYPRSFRLTVWTLTNKEERAVIISERKIFRRIYGPKYENGE